MLGTFNSGGVLCSARVQFYHTWTKNSSVALLGWKVLFSISKYIPICIWNTSAVGGRSLVSFMSVNNFSLLPFWRITIDICTTFIRLLTGVELCRNSIGVRKDDIGARASWWNHQASLVPAGPVSNRLCGLEWVILLNHGKKRLD